MNQQTFDWRTWREEVIREFGVTRDFAVEAERERRIDFLSNYLVSQGLRTFVLGISDGENSSTAGRLAQLSVERIRASGYDAHFVAIRLPYGTQRDEEDARLALDFICPNEALTVDVKRPSDEMLSGAETRGRVVYRRSMKTSCAATSRHTSA